MKKNKYLLYGASGHCKVIIDLVRLNQGEVSFIIDDDPKKKMFEGIEVKSRNSLRNAKERLIISIGNNHTRKKIANKISIEKNAILKHPRAIIDSTVTIQSGTVVMAGAVINASTHIGEHCIINTSTSIDHDCEIGDFVHISPNATLCGNVTIGALSQIGAGSVIIQNVRIGKNVVIGAGSVVLKNVPDNSIVVGNPGRIIKEK